MFDTPPELLLALGVLDADPTAFGCGPIFSSSGRHRFYLADRHDRAGWDATVRDRLACGAFLEPCGRRMLDTDGHVHEVYLDDLHQDGGDVMCRVLSLPSAERTEVRLVEEVPERFKEVAFLAGTGRLAVRGGDRPHLIWVTEARYTGQVDRVHALAAQVGLPPGYEDLGRQVSGVYIDALDLHADGTIDLTPGFLPHQG